MKYVDDSLHGYRTCHLTADSTAELHEFAAELGLHRAAFRAGARGRTAFDRYTVTADERARAVEAGAVEETWRAASFRMLDRQQAALR